MLWLGLVLLLMCEVTVLQYVVVIKIMKRSITDSTVLLKYHCVPRFCEPLQVKLFETIDFPHTVLHFSRIQGFCIFLSTKFMCVLCKR